MPSHSQVAKNVRASKEAHPEYFCVVPSCLWRTAGRVNGEFRLNTNPCKNHPSRKPTVDERTRQALQDENDSFADDERWDLF